MDVSPKRQQPNASSRERRTNEEHRETSVAAVLAAAQYLFTTQGYAATTTTQIGDLAGLSKGAVYFYFEDKEALLHALIDRVREAVLMPTLEILVTADDPIQRIEGMLDFSLKTATENPAMMLLPIGITIEFPSGTRPERRVQAGYRLVSVSLARTISEGQASGQLRADLSPDELASTVIAASDGVMLECLRQELRVNAERFARATAFVVLAGLGAETSRHAPVPPVGDGPSIRELLRAQLPNPSDDIVGNRKE
jgi:AcrR family transcriptional regulator